MSAAECLNARTPSCAKRETHVPKIATDRAGVGSARPVSPSDSNTAWPIRDETLIARDFLLESGTRLDRVAVRFRLEGALNPARDNLVVVVHALTGTPNASEWWQGVIGANQVLDPRRHAILCANLLGGCAGTSGPREDDVVPFPAITTRDQAALLERVINALGVRTPLLVCGGSLGGMVTLEFAASFPDRVRQAVVLAAPAAQTAQALAWHAIMRRAVALGGAHEGLALARMVGMLSYRTPDSLEVRFGRSTTDEGRFAVNEWLNHHGDRLVERFDSRSYVALIDAMDAHDVGRKRGGIGAALAPVAGRLIGVGIPGDILFTDASVREWCEASGAVHRTIVSPFGHDAFLLETAAVSAILHDALVQSAANPLPAPRLTISNSLAAHAGPRRDAVLSLTSRHWTDGGVSGTAATKPLRIALAGCGNVGGSLLQLFNEQAESERRVFVTRVLVRDVARERPSLTRAVARGITSATAVATDHRALLDGDVDVLVEAIGGTGTAGLLVEAALRRGIRVVTANKALLASRGVELKRLAEHHGTSLDFEGAVAAAVPIVRCLRSSAAGVGITRISGILNGTTNVVLERVAQGETLARAVAYAQSEGFAEADPARDLSGEDAEDKLRVLAWLAFGADPSSLRVIRRGVDADTAAWAAQVAREGDAVKLIATCALEDGTLEARVAPTRVAARDAWATVSGPGNRIVVESTSAGTLEFWGAGAGGRATAGAVFGDIFHR
jgi:homoserine O-acetyltransferase